MLYGYVKSWLNFSHKIGASFFNHLRLQECKIPYEKENNRSFFSLNVERKHTMSNVPTNDEQVRAAVSEKYGQAALQVLNTGTAASCGCCGDTCCGSAEGGAITGDLYSVTEL